MRWRAAAFSSMMDASTTTEGERRGRHFSNCMGGCLNFAGFELRWRFNYYPFLGCLGHFGTDLASLSYLSTFRPHVLRTKILDECNSWTQDSLTINFNLYVKASLEAMGLVTDPGFFQDYARRSRLGFTVEDTTTKRIWWTAWDSNPRPPRCERGALPTELAAHFTGGTLLIYHVRRGGCLAWWVST